jgi:hypothetical protein
VLDDFARKRRPLRSLGASGQLGYGIPTPAFEAGLARAPDMIGVDMGSIDIGPAYLGGGTMAPTRVGAKRDLRKVLRAARRLDIPLIVGSAGSAGARPHLDQTLDIIREIAREDGLSFRMAVVAADVPRAELNAAIAAGRVQPMDTMPALTEKDVSAASHIVGQLGLEAFRRALEADVDVVVLGRACDTGIFASIPDMLGFPPGIAMHMAKIIECASLCCVPGGRDTILGVLDDDGFELESMAPQRAATPTSVAAHSLYEQSDPYEIREPAGRADLRQVSYRALDARRTRVEGATFEASERLTLKLEGAQMIGHRALPSPARPIHASSRGTRRFSPRSRVSSATSCARTRPRIISSAFVSTASTACARGPSRPLICRARASSWASASRPPRSARKKWCAPPNNICCTTATRGVSPPPAISPSLSPRPR